MKRTFTKLLALVGLALGATTANANHYWLRGNCWADANDWSDKVTTLSGSKYVVYNVKTKVGNFGIKETPSNTNAQELTWFASSASDTNIVPGGTMGVKQGGGNWYIKSDYACTYTFVFTPTSQLIAAPELYIIKEDGSWNLNSNEKLTYSVANNNYTGTFSINNASGGHFTLSAFTGDWDNGINKLRFSCDGDVTPSFTSSNTYSGNVTLGGKGAFKLPKGEYTLTLDLSSKKITIEKKVEEVVPPTPTYPDTMYILGCVNDKNWNPTNGYKMTKEGDYTFKAENVKLIEPDGGDTNFSFTESLSSTNDWDGLGQRYGGEQNNADALLNNQINKVQEGENAFKVPAGYYDMVLDMKEMTLQLNQRSIIEVDPPKAAIYVVGDGEGLNWDLPGMKVEEDENGNYTFTVNNLSKFKFSKNNSDDWNGTGKFNDGAYKTVKAFSDAVSSDEGETLDLENNGTDQLVPWTGDYTITVSGDFTKMTAKTKTPRPAPYLLVGNSRNAADFSKIEKTDDFKFDVTEDSNISKLRYTFEPGTYYLMVYDGGIKGSYDAGDNPSLNTKDEVNYLAPDGQQGNGAVFELVVKNATTVNFRYFKEYNNGNDKRSGLFAVTHDANPDKMYIFGHINNKYWDEENFEEIPRTDEAGVYFIKNVDISGRWGAHDVYIDETKSRVLYESTEDENYVAFFIEKHGSAKYKFGAYGKNEDVFQAEDAAPVALNDEESKVCDMQYTNELNIHNYKVAEGIYDIEVNLNNYTVKFIKKNELKHLAEFTWFVGENQYDDEGYITSPAVKAHDQDEITLHENNNMKLQVGIGNDTEHIVARQVTYTVKFKEATPALLRRYEAPSTDGYEEVAGTPITEEDSEENHPEAYYFIYGSEAEDDNHLIMLNKPGDYIIEAALHDQATNVENYEEPEPNSLLVTLVGSNTPTGVEGIEAETEDGAVYYNMQGVRVANPAAGEIYIKVAGGNSVKIVR